jgi:hypothetical protein
MAATLTALTLDTSAPSRGSAALRELERCTAELQLVGSVSHDNIWREASKVDSAELE